MKNLTAAQKFNLINQLYSIATARMMSKHFTDENRKMLGKSLEDTLFTCSFNNQPCTSNDFIWKFDRYYGNCWVFNSGYNSNGEMVDFKMSSMSGENYGLILQFYVNFYEKLELVNSIYGIGGI